MNPWRVLADNQSAPGWIIVAWNYSGKRNKWYTTPTPIAPGTQGIVHIWPCDTRRFSLFVLLQKGPDDYQCSKNGVPIQPDCGTDGFIFTVRADDLHDGA